jgi:hypothetical protein
MPRIGDIEVSAKMTVFINNRSQTITVPLHAIEAGGVATETAQLYVQSKNEAERLLSNLREAIRTKVQM